MGIIGEEGQDSIENRYLQASIESSKSNESTEDEVHSALNEAYELLRGVRDSGNDELYQRFRKEYKDLYGEIEKSLKDDRRFGKSERFSILLELGDVVKLADENGIKEKRSTFDKILGRKKDNSKSKEKAEKLLEMKVEEFDKDSAIVALEYLSRNYKTYKDGNNFSWFNSTINDLDDRYEVRVFQDKLLKTILGEGKTQNGNYLKGFNLKKKGNYLVTIADFEEKLKDPSYKIDGNPNDEKTINSHEISSYIEYIFEKEGKQIGVGMLKKYFGKNRLKEMGTLWGKRGDLSKGNIVQSNISTFLSEDQVNYMKKSAIILSDLYNNLKTLDNITLEEIEDIDYRTYFSNLSENELNNIIKIASKAEKSSMAFEGWLKFTKLSSKINKYNISRNYLKKAKEIISQSVQLEIKESGGTDSRKLDAAENINEYLDSEEISEILNKIINSVGDLNFQIFDHTESLGIEIKKKLREKGFIIKEENIKQTINNVTSEAIDSSQKIVTSEIENKKKILLKIKEENEKGNKTPLLNREENENGQEIKELSLKKENIEVKKLIFSSDDNTIEKCYNEYQKNENISSKEILKIGAKTDKNINEYAKEKKIINEVEYYNNFETQMNIMYKSDITISSISKTPGNNTIVTESGYILNGLSDDEFESLNINETVDKDGNKIVNIGNEEALKNLINYKETLHILNLDFVWDNREVFFKIIGNVKGVAEVSNNDGDYVSKYELINILNFILKVIGEDGNCTDEEDAFKRIRDINGGWLNENQKDTLTELGPIGQIFYDKKYYDPHNGLQTINIENLEDSKNWIKETTLID